MTSIKVKGEEIFGLNDSLKSIMMSAKEINGKMHYSLVRNLKYLTAPTKKLEEERKLILESFAKKDENGKLSISENGQISFETKELEDAANEEFKALMQKEYEVEVYKIKEEQYNTITLDPSKIVFPDLFFEYYLEE